MLLKNKKTCLGVILPLKVMIFEEIGINVVDPIILSLREILLTSNTSNCKLENILGVIISSQ